MAGRLKLSAALAVIFTTALGLAGCGLTDSDDDVDPLSPEGVEAFLSSRFNRIPNMFDAFTRLVLAVEGGPADGVTLTPDGNTVQAEVLVDLDGDGSRETTVNGLATFSDTNHSFANGASVAINNITGPSVSGSAFLQVFQLNQVAFQVDGNANFTTSGGTGISVPFLTLSVSPVGPVVLGFLDFTLSADSDQTFGSIAFEDDGQGGFFMSVLVGDTAFEVP